ncbi:LacI family transcriptional regulator [Paenibacillus sabinae T27]|uniref:LacI family transcriptional regulator n=2 Tax=Paenibacillus sabinae TaxID=365617 RepID=X4ZFP0_9BACL|nr:LacI family transcriptional regulator [Paenibacillus sabinae T27]
MEEMNFQPNLVAKNLVSKTTGSICVVLPQISEESFSNSFYIEMIRGIVKQARDSGYDVIISSGANETEEKEAVSRLLRGRQVDGAILLCSRKEDAVVEFLKTGGYPFVLVGRSNQYDDILSVQTNNVTAAYDATRHLISMGHTRIGFISGPRELIVSADRLEGYRNAMRESELRVCPDWVLEGQVLRDSGYRAMSAYMSLSERPTALVVVDDLISFGLLRSLKELGYRVPDDLALVSFNNIQLVELSSPPISSIDMDMYFQGYTASQILIRSLKLPGNRSSEMHKQIVPHRLIVRESSVKARI